MSPIHDSGYKRLFSNPTIFRQLMENFVNQPWVADLDFSRAETLDKSFVSEHYKTTESDLIYRLPYGEGEIYVYVLLEFQSTVDQWMALRMLNYVTNFYMDYVESGKASGREAGRRTGKEDGKLPPIFPVVLYNGDRRWTAVTEINNLIRQEPLLDEYALCFEYFKIAENEYSREQLLGIRNLVSTVFLAEAHYDLNELLEETSALFVREEDKRAFRLFVNWVRQLVVHGAIAENDYKQLEREYSSKEEVRTMLVTAIEREKEAIREEARKEGLEEGREAGLEAGLEAGREKERIEVAQTMHKRGFDLATISEVTGLEIDDIRTLLESNNGNIEVE